MKKQLFIIAALVVAIPFVSFTKKGFDPLDITSKIAENTYMDKAEVTNLNWREYMSWAEQKFGKESKEYLATLPDMSVWKGDRFEKMIDYYLRHAVYDNYPVVGIAHEQAVSYCAWRADRINDVLRLQNKKSIPLYSCRLPTKAEWEKIAKSELMAFSNFKSDFHNLQKVTPDGEVHEQEITSPVKSFTPSLNGYYNLIGNVAELVAENGVAKGGSWQHMSIDVSIERDYPYTRPTKWIGFRCVLERK